jgi:hypothetical protein
MTYYIMQKPMHRSGENELLEFSADTEQSARHTFCSFIVEMLEADDTGHYISTIFEQRPEGWVDLTLAEPILPEDILPELPKWYRGPGIYDESENLIILFDETDLDRIWFPDYTYYLTSVKYDGPKEWH